MELFIAIALLCNQQDPNTPLAYTHRLAKECQQSLLHCVNLKSITNNKEDALNKCIMERK